MNASNIQDQNSFLICYFQKLFFIVAIITECLIQTHNVRHKLNKIPSNYHNTIVQNILI